MLQQTFEVTATRFHAAMQTFVPLINSVVDDTMLQNGPLMKASSATSTFMSMATKQHALGGHRLK